MLCFAKPACGKALVVADLEWVAKGIHEWSGNSDKWGWV